ncbi:MAG: TLD domain-containing protein [Terracidiphilus sp.]|nr:TLD domain-containing protein [Terracidiphilus sp.]
MTPLLASPTPFVISGRCPAHPHSALTRVCLTDSDVICAECFVDGHRGHDVRRLGDGDTLTVVLSRLLALRDTVTSGARSLQLAVEDVDQACADLIVAAKSAQTRFAACVASVKAALDAHAAEANRRLEQLCAERVARLQAQSLSLATTAHQLRIAAAVCEWGLCGSASLPAALALATVTRMRALVQSACDTSPCAPSALDIACDPAPVMDALRQFSSLKTFEVDAAKCEVTGPGVDAFLGKGATNTITIVCRDDRGEPADWITHEDVCVGVYAPGGDSGGYVISCAAPAPGTLTVGYVVEPDATEPITLHVTVCGHALPGFPKEVPCASVHGALALTSLHKHADRVAQAWAPSSAILSALGDGVVTAFVRELRTWLPSMQRLSLLYRGQLDGMSPGAFHRACDGRGPTLTLIRAGNGSTFGGYASVSWSSRNTFVACADAFLFSVVNPHGNLPTRFPIRDAEHAIGCYGFLGPVFGHRSDIVVQGVGVSHATVFNCDSYCNFPQAYVDTGGRGRATFTGAKYFTPEDIEVWAVA